MQLLFIDCDIGPKKGTFQLLPTEKQHYDFLGCVKSVDGPHKFKRLFKVKAFG